MKVLLPSIALVFSVLAAAQVHSASSKSFGSTGGWGSVAFPGTGHPPAGGYSGARPIVNGNYAGPRNGWGYFNAPGRFSQNGGYYRRRGTSYVYAYPVYVGGFYDQPPVVQEPAPAPAYEGYAAGTPAPTVVINNYAAPAGYTPGYGTAQTQPSEETMHTYAGTAHPPAATDPQYYLIALKDHTIYSALAYWVEDSTLHYVTSPNMHNQTSLDLIDTALTMRLNEDRGVPVTLAPAR